MNNGNKLLNKKKNYIVTMEKIKMTSIITVLL